MFQDGLPAAVHPRGLVLYNTADMDRLLKASALVSLGLSFFLSSCVSHTKRPLVDPFPLRFPLTVAGELPIDGRIAGQPWAKDGIVYFRTSDGQVTAVVASSRIVLGRSDAAPTDPGR